MFLYNQRYPDFRAQVPSSIHPKITNLADILALIPVKPEDMPEIATRTNKPTRLIIKAFQEIIQDQAMSITPCYHNLGLLGMIIRASYYDPLNNRNPFAPPIYPGPAPMNATGIATQITKVLRIYKDDR